MVRRSSDEDARVRLSRRSLLLPGPAWWVRTDGPAVDARVDAVRNDEVSPGVTASPRIGSGWQSPPRWIPADAERDDGEFLDDQKYWPIFEAAQALRVPISLHPRDPHPESNRLGAEFLASLPLAPADKEKIAHANAERVLRM